MFAHQVDHPLEDLELDYDTVSRLASLPFDCYTVGFHILLEWCVSLQCHICVRKSSRTSWARLWCLPRISAYQGTSIPFSLDASIGTGSYWILEKTCSPPPRTPPSPPSPPPITIMSPVQFTVIGCLPALQLFSPARSSLAMSRPSLTNSSLQRRQEWWFLERIISCCSGWCGVGLLPAGVWRLL